MIAQRFKCSQNLHHLVIGLLGSISNHKQSQTITFKLSEFFIQEKQPFFRTAKSELVPGNTESLDIPSPAKP